MLDTAVETLESVRQNSTHPIGDQVLWVWLNTLTNVLIAVVHAHNELEERLERKHVL